MECGGYINENNSQKANKKAIAPNTLYPFLVVFTKIIPETAKHKQKKRVASIISEIYACCSHTGNRFPYFVFNAGKSSSLFCPQKTNQSATLASPIPNKENARIIFNFKLYQLGCRNFAKGTVNGWFALQTSRRGDTDTNIDSPVVNALPTIGTKRYLCPKF
jgi:hypothetical protein